MKNLSLFATVLLTSMSASTAVAQLSHNPDKFLGNITTRGSVNDGGEISSCLYNHTHQTGIYVLRDITTGASVKIAAHP